MAVVCRPAVAFPEHVLDRDALKRAAVAFLGEGFPRLRTVLSIIENSGVERRYLVRPLQETLQRKGLGATNDLYIASVKALAEEAAAGALENAGLEPKDIDLLITTSCTGFMIPSMCAHLIPKMGFRRSCVRLPVTELGCAAGAAAMSRAREFCRAYPGANVLIVAVELCSLCFQPEDLSMQALVGGILFGDGAAACVVRDAEVAGLRLDATSTYLFEESWGYMGFDVRDTGFHLILDKDVPGAVERQIAPVMKQFLHGQGLSRDEIAFFCIHPGGRKLMDKVEEAFDLDETALVASRECLAEVGNLSSASILVVLKNTFERHQPKPGDRGFLAAFGPGFSAEMATCTWVEA